MNYTAIDVSRKIDVSVRLAYECSVFKPPR
jgi:hypothetical protein